jgi:glycosyltransferase involved in cell wall biosynthesis
MKRVLFFTQDRWAFASIHHALEKELYKYGIYSNLLNWRLELSAEEWQLLNQSYDLFVTTPEAVVALANAGIPLNKIAAVAHGQWDMLLAQKETNSLDFYPHLYKFGVVSDVLKRKSQEHKISQRIPEVVTMGVHFDVFYRKPSPKLEKVGYGGARETINFFGQEIKRGDLVKKTVAERTPLTLVEHNFYNWMCMPAYYEKIDALVVSSTEESAGLPSMEAAAAGRLVLSTPVGYFEEHGPKGGGRMLPLEPNYFCEQLSNELAQYYYNPDQYVKACTDIQDYARENYNWSNHIEKWVEFLL